MQGEHPAGPWYCVESAKFSPPAMQAIKRLSVGINYFHVPHASRPVLSIIVRPGLAERSEWLGVKQALRFYCRLALQHLCCEFHQCRAL